MRKPFEPLTGGDRVQGAWVAILCGLVFALYHFFGVTDVGYDPAIATRSAFVWIARRWRGDLDTTWFASSHWIPLLTLLMIWSRRRELREEAGAPSALGLAAIAFALLLHWAGARAQQTRISLAAFALLAWAVPFHAAGARVARRLAFPCAFLLLAIPLNFFDSLAHPLRAVAVQLSALLLSGLGLNVAASGSLVFSRRDLGFSLDLADPISGIFPVTALLAGLLAFGFLRRWPWRRYVQWLILLPAVIVGANVTRTLAFALAGEAFGGAAAGAAFRRWSGAVFALAALALLGVLTWMRREVRTRWNALRRPS